MRKAHPVFLGVLLVFLMMSCVSSEHDSDINGVWQGRLEFPGGVKPRIVFKISQKRTGKYSAVLLRPDQDDEQLSIKKIVFKENHLEIELGAIPVAYEGDLKVGNKVIEGFWMQGDKSMPLTLHKLKDIKNPRRPQEPQKPYPYEEEEIYFENKDARIRLAGTLTLPKKGMLLPSVILVSGGGAQNRDGLILGHRPFLVLANHLTRRGIAVLRFDDRGIGESSGDRKKATSEDFAGDVLAAVEYLIGRNDIDSSSIGLVGHSEGGIIAPMAAARSPDVAFIVLMAAPGLPGDEYNYQFTASAGRFMGHNEEQIADTRALQKRIFAVLMKDEDLRSQKKELREILDALIPPMSQASIESALTRYLSPWFRFSISHDPGEVLQKVKCPVLALFAEKDMQVPPEGNIQAVTNALQRGGNADFQVEVIPGLNHLFQTARTGTPDEYAQIEETLSPKILELISHWILEHMEK